MRMIRVSVGAAVLAAAGSAIAAAPQQYPGQMTQARVWVQNRPGEAVPVAEGTLLLLKRAR